MRSSKSLILTLFLVFAMLTMLVTGCGDSRSAKEVVQEATKQQAALNSYSFAGSLKFRANAEGEGVQNGPDAAQTKMVLDALKNSEISFKGTTQADPMQTELILDAKIDFQGMSMNFNVPMIMTKDKMWIKIPAIQMIPQLAKYQGKFVEFDYKELSEMTKQPFNPAANIKAQRELAGKITDILYKNLGNDYFVEEKKESVKLPEGVEASHIVNFKLTNENLAPFLKTLLGTIVPESLDAIANSDLASAYNMNKQQAEETKANLKKAVEELDKDSGKWKENFSIQKADFISAIDKENHVPYSLIDFDATVNVPEEKVKVSFGMTLDMKQTNFNTAPKWEIGIPKQDQVVPFKQLQGGMTP